MINSHCLPFSILSPIDYSMTSQPSTTCPDWRKFKDHYPWTRIEDQHHNNARFQLSILVIVNVGMKVGAMMQHYFASPTEWKDGKHFVPPNRPTRQRKQTGSDLPPGRDSTCSRITMIGIRHPLFPRRAREGIQDHFPTPSFTHDFARILCSTCRLAFKRHLKSRVRGSWHVRIIA